MRTMNLPPSHSESSGFDQLEFRIQRWIWAEGWTSLRDAQERAVPVLIDADQDIIIAAATAAGKTEAAFLPILTNLLLASRGWVLSAPRLFTTVTLSQEIIFLPRSELDFE